MLRKISITIVASAASMLLAGGIASADENSFNDPQNLPALSTYCDAHANDPCPPELTGSAIPSSDELVRLPALETYSDRHANDPVGATGMEAPGGSAIPVQTDQDNEGE